MTRKKVKMAYIANDSARKATFKKRKKGLLKKIDELTTLCGINACAIVYSPYDAQPEVWPADPSEVHRVITAFRMLPEMDQSRKMVNQESYLRQRISKATDHLNRQKRENREKEMTELMYQCLVGNMGMFHLNFMDLRDLGFLIEQFLKDINRRSDILRRQSSSSSSAIINNNNNAESSSAAAAAAGTAVTTALPANPDHQEDYRIANVYEQGGPSTMAGAVDRTAQKQQQQWYTELMDHPEQMGFIAEELGFPFMDTTPNLATAATAAINTAVAPSTSNVVWSTDFFQ